MMKYLRLAFSIWVSVAVYGLASVAVGRTGLLAMHNLESERDRLSSNMDRLRTINGELELSIVALRSDADTISVRARELGYGRVDEHFVRIIGLPAAGQREATAGNLVTAIRPEGVPASAIRILAGLAGLATWVFSAMAGNARNSRSRRQE